MSPAYLVAPRVYSYFLSFAINTVGPESPVYSISHKGTGKRRGCQRHTHLVPMLCVGMHTGRSAFTLFFCYLFTSLFEIRCSKFVIHSFHGPTVSSAIFAFLFCFSASFAFRLLPFIRNSSFILFHFHHCNLNASGPLSFFSIYLSTNLRR
jgi:hypothetical protein